MIKNSGIPQKIFFQREAVPGTPAIIIFIIFISIISFITLPGCHGKEPSGTPVDYTPLAGDDWEVSTPEAEGIDREFLDRLYTDADYCETLYGLLIIKNDKLIAEKYFHKGSVDQLSGRQSITKSFTSALTGIALDRGDIPGLDAKMIDFFPEYKEQIGDPRKNLITVENMLMMKSGYRNEQLDEHYFNRLFRSNNWNWINHLVDFELSADPGTKYQYSEITYHLLGAIVARATKMSMEDFGREYLFGPNGMTLGKWTKDASGYNFGDIEIYLTARDMAKFGRLYMNKGRYNGKQIISSQWVENSLRVQTKNAWFRTIGRYYKKVGYGYGWWSAKAGNHQCQFAWGHGGQLIILVEDLDLIVVTTADPLHEYPADSGWKFESKIINMTGRFIKSLPTR